MNSYLPPRYWYARARQQYGMGPCTAAVWVVGVALVWLLLRPESPALQHLRQRWRPWFAHLRGRPWQPGDSLRHLIQGLALLLLQPGGRPCTWPWQHLKQQQGAQWRRLKATWHREQRSLATKWQRTVLHRLSGLGQHYHRSFILLASLIALPLLALLITQPFDWGAQAIFVILLWSLALFVRQLRSRFTGLMLMVLSVTVASRYLWWRYTDTLNLDSALNASLGLLLLLAETYSWLVLVLSFAQTALPLQRPLAPLSADASRWPTVDVLIPTYNEPLTVVRPTIHAVQGLDWPKEKLRIYLLDDGKRAEFRDFAKTAGVNYVTRPDNFGAKAGNLNHALAKTNGDMVAIFDCDHIPTRSFLQLTVGWLVRDPRVALVQTPHHFFSPDPFERNLEQSRHHPNEGALFYGLVQDGNDLWNAAFFCGSCAVLRRSALEEVGGIATETVTEDAHTAQKLHRAGHHSAYIRVPQAAGLATESLSAHIGQRIRWARGMVQILRLDNPLLGRGLTLMQRLCYLNGMLHFLSGLPRLIYLTIPLAFLLFNVQLVQASAVAVLLYVLPHMAHATLTNSYLQGSYRRTFWGEVYETVLAWYIALPTTIALLAPKHGKFNVTTKGGLIDQRYFDWRISRPYMALALLNLVGLCAGLWRLTWGPTFERPLVLLALAWVVYNLVVLGCAIAVAAEAPQRRRAHRVPTRLEARVKTEEGHLYPATVTDYSEGGVALELGNTHRFAAGQSITLILIQGSRHYDFPAQITRKGQQQLGLSFPELSQAQYVALVQCTFARADAWLQSQGKIPKDRPLRSLREIARISLQGYRQMTHHLPATMQLPIQYCQTALRWTASFLPRWTPAPTTMPNLHLGPQIPPGQP